MNKMFSILVILALAGCATVQAAPRTDGVAAIGESTRVADLIVTPQAVIEDSRCPENVRCIWAGRIIVRALASGEAVRETLDLTLGEPVDIAGGRLALVSALPEKNADADMPFVDYRFAFEFMR